MRGAATGGLRRIAAGGKQPRLQVRRTQRQPDGSPADGQGLRSMKLWLRLWDRWRRRRGGRCVLEAWRPRTSRRARWLRRARFPTSDDSRRQRPPHAKRRFRHEPWGHSRRWSGWRRAPVCECLEQSRNRPELLQRERRRVPVRVRASCIVHRGPVERLCRSDDSSRIRIA